MPNTRQMLQKQLARLCRAMLFSMLNKLEHGRLTIIDECPVDGGKPQTSTFGGKIKESDHLEATITISDKSVWLRLCSNLDAGFAESYMLRHIECEDLLSMFLLYIKNTEILGNGHSIFQFIPTILRLLKPTNDPARALQNASFHYDASNELFAGFLSPDMNYSSPIWDLMKADESLEDAQMRKVRLIVSKARITAEHHILDIGCGWGSLAIEAARSTGCRVTAITLSKEQKTLADERIKEAGLQHRIECIVCDYRKAPRPPKGYDRIVSIEMIEHVGMEHMDGYFASISSLLTPQGGIMVVQGITIINQLYKLHRNADNFIERYVFPGGYLPTIALFLNSVDAGSKGTLEVDSVQSIGPHYSKTLRLWREKFLQNWPAIKGSMGEAFNARSETEIEAFRRKWLYYFTYCEAGFKSGVLTDHIVTAVRKPEPAAPFSVPL